MSEHISEEMLNDYLDDELTAPTRERVAAHLALCLSCADRLRDLREVTHGLRSLPMHDAAVEQLRPIARRAVRRRRVTRPALAAAALLIVGLGTVVLLRTGSNDAPPLRVELAPVLNVIDTAIRDLEQAARQDPANPVVQDLLNDARRRRLEVEHDLAAIERES